MDTPSKIPDHEWEMIRFATVDEAEPCKRCGTRKKLMLRRRLGQNEAGIDGTVSVWRCPKCWEEESKNGR